MAIESVGISEPSTPDKNVATDRVDGLDYQAMKLMIGGDGLTEGFLGDALPLPVRGKTTSFATGSGLTVDDVPKELVAANAKRLGVRFFNLGDETIFVGPTSGVTAGIGASAGWPLFSRGDEREQVYTGAVFGVCESGLTSEIRVWEDAITP